jgi:NAD-dependent dihydropyrimidine dehydrogenase PreA subunit
MSHIVAKDSYKSLEERLNRFPQGAPPSETLYKILRVLFTEKEAALVAQLPIKPFTVKTASYIWKLDEVTTKKNLDELARKAILIDAFDKGVQKYIVPPPMAGFFEFALMRTSGEFDQQLISELFHQYMNVEEDFVKDLFWGTETKMGRVYVQEAVLSNKNEVNVLDYERASHFVKTEKDMAVSMCYCRHKAHHLGTACDAPMDVCMTFGNTARSLVKYGHGRKVGPEEGLELLQLAYESNLVQCGENVREDITFLCNCCGCCCEAFVTAKRIGMHHPISTTNFIPKIIDTCVGCGKCAKVCPIDAIKMEEVRAGNGNITRKLAKIDQELCLGCGVCVRSCTKKSIYLEPRKERILTPVNTTHRVVVQAIEKGKLAELIFDNKAFASHRAMAAILSVILKLPPIKQVMASKQMKSVYLDRLISKMKI